MIGSEPFEERTEGWHAGGDEGEVVLNAAMGSVRVADPT